MSAQEVREIEGGGLGSVLRRIYQSCRDGVIYEAVCYLADKAEGLTPEQSANYYQYRRM